MRMLTGLKERYWSVRKALSEQARYAKFRVTHRGVDRRCNICGWRGTAFFHADGHDDIECPVCKSKPRQRLLKLVLGDLGLPEPQARILHVSPLGERGLVKWFRRRSSWYLSIDVEPGIAMKQMDLVDLKLPDASVDFVCCSHVLVYVRDDAKALSEIYRVLAPGGTAVLQVPLLSDKTRMVDTPTQEDFFHLWHPGTDYFDRYRDAGFSLQLFHKRDYDETLYGLHYDLVVPVCRKKLEH